MTPALALVLILTPPAAPTCAEGGRTTMDPRLEHALRISTRVRIREPRPTLYATREKP